MKRAILILVLGVIVGIIGYWCADVAWSSRARSLQQSGQPELAWLKEEFGLSDTQFKRISELHESYLPQCRSMCDKIDAQNTRLEQILRGAANVTPELDQALAETARLRTECQAVMLRHFFEVSGTMQPEQGRRYLSWVVGKAFLASYAMDDRP